MIMVDIYLEFMMKLPLINLYKSRGQVDSHDIAVFLQLYYGHPWSQKTGKFYVVTMQISTQSLCT